MVYPMWCIRNEYKQIFLFYYSFLELGFISIVKEQEGYKCCLVAGIGMGSQLLLQASRNMVTVTKYIHEKSFPKV